MSTFTDVVNLISRSKYGLKDDTISRKSNFFYITDSNIRVAFINRWTSFISIREWIVLSAKHNYFNYFFARALGFIGNDFVSIRTLWYSIIMHTRISSKIVQCNPNQYFAAITLKLLLFSASNSNYNSITNFIRCNLVQFSQYCLQVFDNFTQNVYNLTRITLLFGKFKEIATFNWFHSRLNLTIYLLTFFVCSCSMNFPFFVRYKQRINIDRDTPKRKTSPIVDTLLRTNYTILTGGATLGD